MILIQPFAALLGVCALTACATAGDPGLAPPGSAPPGAPPGTCWAQAFTPAVFETTTEQVLLEPAAESGDGKTVWPAVYQTETRQEIVKDRKSSWFETPCPDVETEEFIASLQRALTVRRLYDGPVTGRIDTRTRAAVRAFQAPGGIDSGILSLKAARDLGLVAIPLKS